MRRLLLPLLSCTFLLGLSACDKAADPAKKAEPAKAEEPKAEGDKAEGDKAEGDKAEGDKAEGGEAAGGEEIKDDTIGFGGVVRAAAGDTNPAAAPAEAPSYDTSQDAGGLIGHLASGLVHDEALAGSPTTAELLKLAHEEAGGPSDNALCKHVMDKALTPAYPDAKVDADAFTKSCTTEAERQRVKLGVEIFAQHAKCILAAADLAAVDACDAAEQAAEDFLHANPHGDRPEDKLCVAAVEHISVLISRHMVSDPDMLEVLEEHIDQVKDDAKLACRDEGTKDELSCIMKAAKLEDLETCS